MPCYNIINAIKGGVVMGKICSFTGHRIIDKRHKKSIGSLVARAVEFAYENGVRTFLAGGAIGFDTLAAKAVINFRISHSDVRLKILVPCKNQSQKWNDYEKSVYEYILSASDEVEYFSEEYYDGCMKERNAALAERCDMLIAYVGRTVGGSAQTYRMAEKLGKKIYNLYPTLGKE